MLKIAVCKRIIIQRKDVKKVHDSVYRNIQLLIKTCFSRWYMHIGAEHTAKTCVSSWQKVAVTAKIHGKELVLTLNVVECKRSNFVQLKNNNRNL